MIAAQQVLNLPHKPTYGAGDFVVSATNMVAYRWIQSWPEWSNHCLILYGPKGCGKTHLAEIWKSRAGGLSVTFEQLQTENIDELCQQHKALLVEDIPAHFDETLLFHLYNAVKQADGYLLITSETPPSHWSLTLPDLRSRMQGALWAEIEPADDYLLRAMMRKVFSDEQVMVPDAVLEYLLNHHERSFAQLMKAVREINTYAMATKRRITLPLVRQVLTPHGVENGF